MPQTQRLIVTISRAAYERLLAAAEAANTPPHTLAGEVLENAFKAEAESSESSFATELERLTKELKDYSAAPEKEFFSLRSLPCWQELKKRAVLGRSVMAAVDRGEIEGIAVARKENGELKLDKNGVVIYRALNYNKEE